MPQHGARDDVRGCGSAASYCGFNGSHAAVVVQFFDYSISLLPQVVEAFFICADEQDGYFFLLALFVASVVITLALTFFGSVDEADVHIQIAILVEARQANRNPVFSATGFDASCFEEHVEDQLQIARMQ